MIVFLLVFAVGRQCLDLLCLQMPPRSLLVGMDHRGPGAYEQPFIYVFSDELGCLDNTVILPGVIRCVHLQHKHS